MTEILLYSMVVAGSVLAFYQIPTSSRWIKPFSCPLCLAFWGSCTVCISTGRPLILIPAVFLAAYLLLLVVERLENAD